VQRSGAFDAYTAAALALGMKLFGEVMLQHCKDPLFEPIVEPYREFIGAFKAGTKVANTPSDSSFVRVQRHIANVCLPTSSYPGDALSRKRMAGITALFRLTNH
jgi:hypothetical protein